MLTQVGDEQYVWPEEARRSSSDSRVKAPVPSLDSLRVNRTGEILGRAREPKMR
jgi:hypothetical protein